MAKSRELTEVEKFYVQNNLEKSDSQISQMMKGIGTKTIEKYRESLPKQEKKQEADDTEHITESREERIDRLGNGPNSGEFISRREGVAIMTQQASEVSDARKVIKGKSMSKEEFEENNRNKIHRPNN
tara:strand:+ start:107 stop:490 length:384 start_codon:yes stop_codon:yes gene_type:complete